MINKYNWIGIQDQTVITGTDRGENHASIKQQCDNRGITLIHCQPCKGARSFQIPLKRLHTLDAHTFIQQLLPLIEQGFHIADSINILSQCTRGHEKKILLNITHEINTGTAVSDAIKNHTDFSAFIISLFQIAEKTGQFGAVLQSSYDYLQAKNHLKNNIKQAVRYPLFLLTFTLLITVALLVFILPQFQHTFTQFGATLPTMTQTLIQVSTGLQRWGWAVLLACLCLVIIIWKIDQHCPQLRVILFYGLKKLPVTKTIINDLTSYQILSLIDLSLQANLPLTQALSIASQTQRQPLLKQALTTCLSEIETGTPFSEALNRLPILNQAIQAQLRIAEAANAMESVMRSVTQYLNQTLLNRIKQVKKWLEPVFMLAISLIIGSIVISLYLPIIQMGTAI